MAVDRTSLYERQWNEADAIKSIYLDEFEEKAEATVLDYPPSFILHFEDHSGGGKPISASIEFSLPAEYPEVEPKITVKNKRGISTVQLEEFQNNLEKRSKELVGEEMIFELAEYAKSLLANFAKKKVSFHDEMMSRKKEIPEADFEKKELFNLNEAVERADIKEISRKIQQDLELKEKLIHEEKYSLHSIEEDSAFIDLKTPIILEFEGVGGETCQISRLSIGEQVSVENDYFGVSYWVKSTENSDFRAIASKITISSPFYTTIHGRKKLASAADKLYSSAKISSSPLYSRIIGLSIQEKNGKIIDLWIIFEPFEGIAMDKIVECCGKMSVKKAVMYAEQVLNALNELHSQNLPHQDLTLTNIILSLSLSRIKLINMTASRLLRDLHQLHPFSNCLEPPNDITWRPPEILSRGAQYSRKSDIWFVGHLFIQLLFSTTFPQNFDSPSECIDHIRKVIPSPIVEVIALCFITDTTKRPSTSELLKHECFSPSFIASLDENAISLEEYMFKSERVNIIPSTPRRQIFSASRYRSDFEEIQFLGKGAFGEVIKVKNRIDNRFYAIKRIRLDPSNIEHNSKILREVTTLSRLHHERIVRYFQAWIEGTSNEIMQKSVSLFTESETEAGSESEEWLSEGVSSRKLYNFDAPPSTSSLSSLIKFHTGFTSEEENSTSGPLTFHESTDHDDGPQYLYIQMEYCPNQSLRDVIDAGVDEEDAWRLFRQILEGLSYVHSLGMIHRDLKPGNIFLDINGNVKIGDFGLAIGDETETRQKYSASPTLSNHSVTDADSDSFTGGIGTPMYVSPEQCISGKRYNQKVDMYSLGIILLELLVPFKTGMERALVIKGARNVPVAIPNTIVNSNAVEILQSLLSHDPKTRPSSDDLLRSGLLPARVEDEHVAEVIRSVCSPSSNSFQSVLNALFGQTVMDPIKDYTFDFHSDIIRDPRILHSLHSLKSSLTLSFSKNGAIYVDPPLLLPITSKNMENSVTVLLPSGALAAVSTIPIVPFSRYIAHYKINELKRFSFSQSLQTNPTGCQPQHVPLASYDIVFDDSAGPCRHEVSLIIATFDAIKQAMNGLHVSYLFRVGNGQLLRSLLLKSLVPETKIESVIEVLHKNSTAGWGKVKSLLSSQVILPLSTIDSLTKLSELRDLDANIALRRLSDIFRNDLSMRAILSELEILSISASSLHSIECKISIDPLLSLDPLLYKKNYFQILSIDKRKNECIAYGGNYSSILDWFRLPTDDGRNVQIVGGCFQLTRLLSIRLSKGEIVKREKRVLLYSNGNSFLKEKIRLMQQLQENDFIVELLTHPSPKADYLNHLIRHKGLHVTIMIKEVPGKSTLAIKVRNLEKRQEYEATESDFLSILKDQFKDTQRNDISIPNFSNTSLPPNPSIAVSLFSPATKIKGAQKTFFMDKAVRAATPLISHLHGENAIQVVSLDVSHATVRTVIDSIQGGDDLIRRGVEISDRESAVKLRNLIISLLEKYPFVFLYNYREEWIDFAINI